MIFKKKIKEQEEKPTSKIYDLIRKPLVTEKGTLLSNNSQIVFLVPMDASKLMVKKAVESLFKVNVEKVNIIISKGKKKDLKEDWVKEKMKKKQLFL